MISSTPSPSISPAKSSLVMTSSSMYRGACSVWVSCAAAGTAVSCTACTACTSGAACALGLRPRRLGSAFAGSAAGVSACGGAAAASGSAAVAGFVSIGSSGSAAASGCGAAFSFFASRGRRPRGALAFGAAVCGAASCAGFAAVSETSPFAPASFSAGASSGVSVPAIFSISSRFLIITFLIPNALAISRNSARLFPSSAFRSCIVYFR